MFVAIELSPGDDDDAEDVVADAGTTETAGATQGVTGKPHVPRARRVAGL
jgi:hypothetical protein